MIQCLVFRWPQPYADRYKQDTMTTYVSLCREFKRALVKPCQLTVD